MIDTRWFSVAGLACVKHTPETLAIWEEWEDKSNETRNAIIKFAMKSGFSGEGKTHGETAKKAFNYLIEIFPFATKSNLIRHAIVNFS